MFHGDHIGIIWGLVGYMRIYDNSRVYIYREREREINISL